MTYSNFIAHSEPLLKELNLLKVTDLLELKNKFLFNLYHNRLPPYFDPFRKPPENIIVILIINSCIIADNDDLIIRFIIKVFYCCVLIWFINVYFFVTYNNTCGCLHRTGMFEVYNRVKTIIVFTDVFC